MIDVMIVDDEHLERVLIEKSFDWEANGFRISATASDGSEALELCKKRWPDIILTDINMPFMDGLELGRRVKACREETEIIIISGFNDFAYAKRGIEIGIRSYILKPLDRDELSRALLKGKHAIEAGFTERERPRQEPPRLSREDDSLGRVARYMDEHFADPDISLKSVAREFYMNESYLSRVFKQYADQSFVEYLMQKRMKTAMELFRSTDMRLYEVAESVGIHDPNYFGKCFKKYAGETANQFRARNRDAGRMESRV